MESSIAQAIEPRYPPVALNWTDAKPEGAMQFQEGKWGCVMWLAAAAARGRNALCGAGTCGCPGGGVGLGFGNAYRAFPGGEEGFCHFLSSGIEGWPEGPAIAEGVRSFLRPEAYDNFVHGERYLRSPSLVRRFLEELPMTQIPRRYVLFTPLAETDPSGEPPRTVILFVDADELAALVVLANHHRGGNQNVIIPFAAGCQTIGIHPYREALDPQPRAVVGLTDLSARLAIRKQLGDGLLTFAMPWALYREMEANVAGSFLERPPWKALLEAKRAARKRAAG